MKQEEFNRMTEYTSSISMITYERLEDLIVWLQKFIKVHNEQMQFVLETALMANINPELKKRAYLNKRMDELEALTKGFISYYNSTPHHPTLKEIQGYRKSKAKVSYK
jgi:hypothetical protein